MLPLPVSHGVPMDPQKAIYPFLEILDCLLQAGLRKAIRSRSSLALAAG